MKEIWILGILITDRIKEAGKTQQLLTKYASLIKTRLGFHELSMDKCSRQGVIVVQLIGSAALRNEFEQNLSEIGGISVQKMIFNQ